MSLLLDALKKAAEKKARKNAEDARSADATGKDQGGIEHSSGQPEEHAERFSFDASDTTQLDATEIEKPDLESTEYDRSEFDQTEIDRTDLDLTDIDSTDIDKTDIDRTDVQATAVNLGEIDETSVDATGIEATDLDHSHTQTHTDFTDTHVITQTLTEEDKTLQFYEDDDDDAVRIDTETGDKTQTQITDTRNVYRQASRDAGDQLTEDDVTEFMGDGLTAEEVEKSQLASSANRNLGTDDTTITNRDSLNLGNVDYEGLALEPQEDEGYPVAREDERSVQPSGHGYDGRAAEDQVEEDLELEDIPENEKPTVVNVDTTSSTVDLDRLTSDETVTIKDSTATRTFAPDNYDRTLLKLAQSDVSRIFPGMKQESDTVMTPDYAKKVFLNKSQGIKHSSYKAFAGIAFLILITVSVWGMFEFEEESEMIDRSLLGLKRDPMPGIIKPKNLDDSTILFPVEPTHGKDKVIGILANADQGDALETDELVDGQAMSNDNNEMEVADSTSKQQSAQDSPSATQRDQVTEKDTVEDKSRDSQVVKKRQNIAQATIKGGASERASGDLVITSSSRVSEKDQFLNAAYRAYESADYAAASRLYDQVLSLDPENRDALLGRAALYIKDNQADKAIRFYQQVLEANPKDSMAMTSLISVINIDPVAGETQIKNLLREQPDAPYLHFALGNMYGSQQRWVEAQSAYFTALKHKPNDPNYAYNLAVSMEHMQKPNTAITFYQRALDNNAYGQATFDSQLVSQRIEVLSQ